MAKAHTTSKPLPVAEPHWPAQAIACVQHKGKRGGYRYRYESHAGLELVYVDYGRMMLKLADRNEILSPGDCFILPARTPHSIQSDGDRAFSFLNVLYRGPSGQGGLRGICGRVLHLSAEQQRAMGRLRDEAAAALKHSAQIVLLRFNLLLLEIDRSDQHAAMVGRAEPANEWNFRDAVVMRALEYLQAQPAAALDAAEVAAAAVGASHLRRLVRRQTGKTLGRHLQEFMDAAWRMLLESSSSVTEIARRVGYESPPHFCTISSGWWG